MNFIVLLVDDDPDEQLFFSEAFKAIEHKVRFDYCRSGDEMFSLLAQCTPSVIFIDINMPRDNGFTVITKLKTNYKYADIPVIIYSTSRDTGDMKKAYQVGADLFFTKEDSIKKLTCKLRDVLDILHSGKPLKREDFPFLPFHK